MNLSGLDINIFLDIVGYLDFDTVISICQVNKKLHKYFTGYNNNWKLLIDNTYSSIEKYDEKLMQIQNKLNYNHNHNKYNHLVYTQLIKLLDPITQLMIYYRQGNNKFDSYKKEQQFLSLFLLNKKDVIKKYLPDDNYQPFIDLLNGHYISNEDLNWMLIERAKEGNILGIKYFENKGADIHADDDLSLRWASRYGHLEVVKYLIENGANVHAGDDYALILASICGHLEVVKYLIEKGADIHARDDFALQLASRNGHLEMVKFLHKEGANVHAQNDWAIQLASQEGHLEVVKYLIEKGANIHAEDDYSFQLASENGYLDVVEYLKSL